MLKTSEDLPTLLEVTRDSRRMRSLIFRVETEDIIPQGPTLWGRNPNTFKRVSDTQTLRYAHNPQKSGHCHSKNDIGVSVSVSECGSTRQSSVALLTMLTLLTLPTLLRGGSNKIVSFNGQVSFKGEGGGVNSKLHKPFLKLRLFI